ncbi:MAG TPA: DNA/RNA non-specific endonuclease [Alphaproteobacteria bacterium]|jgi:endonuclease G|nr:DNA/RNA non-specific endonuclease [Alphaproteobacteria bacterium]
MSTPIRSMFRMAPALISALIAFVVLPLSALGQIAECASMVRDIGAPEYKGNPPQHMILCRKGYVLSHNAERRTPDWVVELLTPDRFVGPGDRKREGDPFAPDPDLMAEDRAELRDYRKSGFDRGHMAPAASMKFDVEAMRQSFYLSNMAPQVGRGLNQHIWADLEALVREWTCDRGRLIVVTGPIYDGPPRTIGEGAVAVPNAFYKIAYDPTAKRALAFILPNAAVKTRGQPPSKSLRAFVATVGEIEERSGLDFLSGLASRDERRIEATRSAVWPVRAGCGR